MAEPTDKIKGNLDEAAGKAQQLKGKIKGALGDDI
jgi:uncharacterized protein YjbJ (UPF0337 family)